MANQLMTQEDYVPGTEDLGRADLKMPVMILVQAQHQDIPNNLSHLGQWYNSVTGEFSSAIEAVLISVAKGRAAFARQFSRDSDPVCASDDAIAPREQYVGTTVEDAELQLITQIPSLCAQCIFQQFGTDGTPPLCAAVYTYAMIDVSTGSPFLLRAQRTAASAAKQLNTVAMNAGRKRMIVITSQQVKSDKGTYYVPVFTLGESVDPQLKQSAADVVAQLGNPAKRLALSAGDSAA